MRLSRQEFTNALVVWGVSWLNIVSRTSLGRFLVLLMQRGLRRCLPRASFQFSKGRPRTLSPDFLIVSLVVFSICKKEMPLSTSIWCSGWIQGIVGRD